jgi:Zn-dependent protease with chaperone function
MTTIVWLPFVASGLLGLLARPIASRITPRPGVWLLATAGLVSAVSTTWALLLLSVSLVDDIPGTFLSENLPILDPPSIAASGVLLIVLVRLVALAVRQRDVVAAVRPVLAQPGGELVVIPDQRPLAFAAPGRSGQPGRIVVTDAMLAALTAPQRRVVLAHERAHLSERHSVALTMAGLAAAANPILAPVQRAVAFLCERDADERAASAVGDRVLVAEALAAAALVVRGGPSVHALPAFHRQSVVDRVAALTEGYRRQLPPAWMSGVTGAAVVAAGAAAYATGVLIEMVTRLA